jgi:hypothetical protein
LGQELAPEGCIQLIFDRAMNASAVESAFAVQPAATGKITWADPRTLVWKPDKALPRGATYDVVINQNAKAADGGPLRSAYQFRFATAGYLEVGQVMPAPDTTDVDPAGNARITVIFNRPVVPLTSLDQQASFPQPLAQSGGQGKASGSTLIYVFSPTNRCGGTVYTARISGVKIQTATHGIPITCGALRPSRPRLCSPNPTIRRRRSASRRTCACSSTRPWMPIQPRKRSASRSTAGPWRAWWIA